jgi:DNA-binding Lrp family transcriptional regulator
MDDTDRRLIALLRENARLPVATLARLLKVSRGTVQNRIDRLTTDGVIGGFTVRVLLARLREYCIEPRYEDALKNVIRRVICKIEVSQILAVLRDRSYWVLANTNHY